jgi:CSLREA domain-containing protein
MTSNWQRQWTLRDSRQPGKSIRRGIIIGIALFEIFLSTSTQAAVFTVNVTIDADDDDPGDGVCDSNPPKNVCTLRAAIQETNALSGTEIHEIILPPNTYVLTQIAKLIITSNLTITGGGASTTIIDGNKTSRPTTGVLTIVSGAIVSISGVTIRNGKTADNGGGINNDHGILTLTNSIVSGNNSGSIGGGIFNISPAVTTLINSTVSGNTANIGGGISNVGGTVTLFISTVSGNTAFTEGGGIGNAQGPLTVSNSTVSGNLSSNGGGISNTFLGSAMTLVNSTVSGNRANNNGGGIYNTAVADLFSSTITNNQADADFLGSGTGGGVFNMGFDFKFQNTIIAGNFETGLPAPNEPLVAVFSDCAGSIQSQGNNLMRFIDSTHCTVMGGVTLANPMLGPLQNNGGPTQTHALLSNSPAIDAGSPGGCQDFSETLMTTDQRGATRPIDGNNDGTARCDIGAVEFGSGVGAPADFDGDDKTDISVYQTNTGNWFYVRSNFGFGQHLSFGGANFLPVPGDYDGDNKTDDAVYDTTNGNWFIAQSTAGFKIHPAFGGTGFIPVPADYDGDGKTDLGVYQVNTGHWFFVRSTLGFGQHLAFGGPGFVPVPGDHDGDGKTDTAVYDTTIGNWFIAQSTAGFKVHPSFGGAGFIPVPGDYDNDGKMDVAVYQKSTGHWFMVGSTDGFMQHLSFGGSGFTPVPGDYDGDGQTDTAVYDTTNGNWFIAQSLAGFRIDPSFGGSGFVPVLPQVTILRALGVL